MRRPSSVLALLGCSLAASGALVTQAVTATAAGPPSRPGQTLYAARAQVLIYAQAGRGSYIGSLRRGGRAIVRRASPTGRWVLLRVPGAAPDGWAHRSQLTVRRPDA